MKLGHITAILSAILFGLAGIFVKFITELDIDSIDLIILQYILIVLISFIIIALLNINLLKITKIQFYHLLILGAIGDSLMTVFYYKSFYYLPVGVATVLLYTSPIFVFIYSVIFQKIKFTIENFFMLITVFAGCIMALGILSFEYSGLGILYGVLASAAFAFMNIYSSKKLVDINAASMTFYSMLFSLIPLCIYRFPTKELIVNIPVRGYIYIAILAFICASLPLALFYYSIKKIGSLNTSIIGNLEIPTAIIAGFLILKEKISMLQLLGIIIVVFGVYKLEKNS